jgi:hypothetical protein
LDRLPEKSGEELLFLEPLLDRQEFRKLIRGSRAEQRIVIETGQEKGNG